MASIPLTELFNAAQPPIAVSVAVRHSHRRGLLCAEENSRRFETRQLSCNRGRPLRSPFARGHPGLDVSVNQFANRHFGAMENDAFRLETVLFHPFLGFPFLEPLARLACPCRTPCQLAAHSHTCIKTTALTLSGSKFARRSNEAVASRAIVANFAMAFSSPQ